MTEPKSTDRSALVGRLRKCADHFQMSALVPGETMSVVSLMAEAAALIESPPAGEIQGLVERAMALANAATTAPWFYVNGWISTPAASICELTRLGWEPDAEFIAASRQLIPELCEAITRLSTQPQDVAALVERLRAQAKAASEVSWILSNAKTARNRAAEGEPNDGNGYQGLDPEQTIEWKAAEAITRLSQPSEKAKP